MAKKKSDGGETVNAPAPTAGKKGGPRGPRNIKLTVPAEVQAKVDSLPELYPLKKGDAQSRYLACLGPSLTAAYADALDQLIDDLEHERDEMLATLRGIAPVGNMAPDESYAPLDDETAQ